MKRAFTLIEFIVIVVIILILAAILFPVFTRGHPTPRRVECQLHLKQIGLSMMQYAQDYNDRFPPVGSAATQGWKDVLAPYAKSEILFQCPTAPQTSSPLTDYFYNRRIARWSTEKVEAPAITILSGDGADDAPPWNSIAQLPSAWKATPEAPSRRHLDLANYLFADGHVKSLRPSAITTASPLHTDKPTFAVK